MSSCETLATTMHALPHKMPTLSASRLTASNIMKLGITKAEMTQIW
jgi:hypothetical protein